jgi:hypothetical protein
LNVTANNFEMVPFIWTIHGSQNAAPGKNFGVISKIGINILLGSYL